jgi:hypothetical protein
LLPDAIRAYYDLLTDNRAAEAQGQLDDDQRRRGLLQGDQPLCRVLRPRFLTPELYRFLQEAVQRLLPALDRVYQAALADPALRAQFRLSAAEERLLRIDPGFPCPCPAARLEGVLVSERELRFTEYSVEAPAGAAYADALTELFLGLPVVGDFLRRYQLRPLPARPGILHALLAAYREWPGRHGEPPRLAIVDWREVPTYGELVLFADYFRRHGIECVVVDPRVLEYRGGRLLAGDFHANLVYRRALTGELLERGGSDHPVIRAAREGSACVVNSFRGNVLARRASFAVLSDERNAARFTPPEREAIAALIPWTRCVEERRTLYDGEMVDLVPFLLENRARFVLKPNDEAGDPGVVGREVPDADWEKAVRQALEEPTVAQEVVAGATEPFAEAVEGRVVFPECPLDTSLWVCHGAYAEGCLTRVATGERPDGTPGGVSIVPTFLVEERP